ncbi:Pyruvate-utilizing enzyme, similar to phosphoenolpyruvate synthase [hydrothermal vent metagenome]|uniref:Pyruvate-utilizing enzyme, similar to phosphoenolpyruvate synthase n=1 Tax=hydrothermal vent metagenome TaxID=652676 RepID=A0A3B1B0H8_9ZZZZ
MIYFSEHISDDLNIGGKARALANLELANFKIPAWFVITPEEFYASLADEDKAMWLESGSTTSHEDLQASLTRLSINPNVIALLHNAMSRLCPKDELVAVRSSAVDEDGAEHSFAGQLESVLFVDKAQLAQRIIQVWRSGFSERIFTYRKENKLSLPPPPPAVLVQRMINAEAAGVAFSADPVSGRRATTVVGAVYGLGSALVSGDVDADTYYVDRLQDITQCEIANKRQAHAMDPTAVEGVKLVDLDEDKASQSVLSDEEVKEIARIARRSEKYFNCPQDIEWAKFENRIYLLQSRPITSIQQMADPDANLIIWDNSNIAESYRGVTTPLTFSFASRAYTSVYREFCHLMRVPKKLIAENDALFARMLGLIRGQVYYNLISWYQVLALLPGFQMNRKFMEQMMGVKEAMPEEVINRIVKPTSTWDKFHDGMRLASTLSGLVLNHFLIPSKIKKFYKRLNTALADPEISIQQKRADELIEYYHELERQLLKRWDAPLINDFFAMIFYGVLRKLTEKWCEDTDGTLQNDLLVGEGDIISAEPAQRIRKMGEMIFLYPELIELLCEGSVLDIYRRLPNYQEFYAEYYSYLKKFGDRCLDELKLESPTLHDNPLPVLRSIGHMAKRLQTNPEKHQKDRQQRLIAEDHVRELFAGAFFRKRIFNWVLKNTRKRVSDRENLRFERTRVFGRIRNIFVELGFRLRDLGIINEPRDIFYLEVGEIVNYVEGTSSTHNLAALIELRKKEFKEYEDSISPADRFETRGIIYHGHNFESKHEKLAVEGDEIHGIGCCPGVVRGQVRVVRDPRGVELHPGEILVAERTDPGWIMLFPACSGLLVEHGSLLSHSAIVAREMGIPAVVSLDGVTDWLKDGDWVEMDGRIGSVRKINNEFGDGNESDADEDDFDLDGPDDDDFASKTKSDSAFDPTKRGIYEQELD